jgi:hypothetical protein
MSSKTSSARYPVVLRGISADLQEVGPHLADENLGDLDSGQVLELLEGIVTMDPVRLLDGDPQILISGRRGAFSAKPNRGNLLLKTAGDFNAAYLELPPAEVTAWLDETEGDASTAELSGSETPLAATVVHTAKRRRLAAVAMIISLMALAVSAYLTLRPRPLIPDSAFSPIVDQALLNRLTEQVIGRYANTEQNTRLIVESNGRLTYRETNDTGEPPEDTVDRYVFRSMTGVGAVLRTKELGAIAITDANTLTLNGEKFYRVGFLP